MNIINQSINALKTIYRVAFENTVVTEIAEY